MATRKIPVADSAAKTAVASTPSPASKKPAAAKKVAKKVVGAAVKKAAKKSPTPESVAKKSSASPVAKPKKTKLVRDSFTMPAPEYAVIAQVKKACLAAGFEIKKSELLRVGIALIQKLDTKGLRDVLATLAPLKAGRPKK